MMKLLYMGFTHKTPGTRSYNFEGVAEAGQLRKGLYVTAEVALLTKHHIRIQEVPMMCLRLLETASETETELKSRDLTEADMLAQVQAKALELEKAASKRAKRPFTPAAKVALGMAWRS